MTRTTQVECIIFRKDPVEFLLLRRIPEKGGFWQPVTGGLEPEDDSHEAGVVREVMEETGIAREHIVRIIPDVHYFVMDKHYLTGEDRPPLEEFVFGVEVSREVVVDLENNVYPEHDAYEWVSFEKAMNMLKWDDNKDSLKKLLSLM